jgi:hypothetical protein
MAQTIRLNPVPRNNDQNTAFNRPIFVVGLPRSGTSLVAGLLHEFGAWTGETVPGTGENPTGFFENGEIREKILKPTLRAVNGDAGGIMRFPDACVAQKIKYPFEGRRVSMALRIRKIIESQGYDNVQRWMYKEPKVTLLWRMFDHSFPNAQWIIVRRERAGFVKSCIKTSFMAQYSKDEAFWNNVGDEYDRRLDALADTVSNVTQLQTSDILSGDLSALKKLVKGMDGMKFLSTKVQELVNPNHWHHR